MILATIRISGVRAVPSAIREIPAGIIGGQVKLEYLDVMWDGLAKTVVFSSGRVTKDVINAGELVTIPPEVVTKPGMPLLVGIYGTDAAGNIAIPTLWADLGRIRSAADPSGDTSTDPSLPVWAQLDDRVSRLEQGGTGGTVSPEEIKKAVADYLEENPPVAAPVTINGEKPDENGNFIINTVSDVEIASLSAALT